MESSDFDAFSRLLGNAGSRRRALAALGATLGLLGWQGSPDFVEAKKRRKKHKKRGGTTSPPPTPTITCPTGYTACGEQCFDLSDNPSNCGTCAVVCSPNKTCCNGVCVDLLDNDSNCATCGNQCLPDPTIARAHGAVCVNGTCEQCAVEGTFPPQPSPLTRCCRGLYHCQTQSGTFDACIPDGSPCPP